MVAGTFSANGLGVDQTNLQSGCSKALSSLLPKTQTAMCLIPSETGFELLSQQSLQPMGSSYPALILNSNTLKLTKVENEYRHATTPFAQEFPSWDSSGSSENFCNCLLFFAALNIASALSGLM
eukprot:TRINITY_DN58443_c0_g1_i1.p1 TRINITY_DN58443_c0_g1~~TRINITY_DN58443_c0_g1_i1.p1  ORF type:complete len:124 (-),score=9.67 TRINITY_DN58443_c0_g1_i1:265-636(-)